MHDALVPAGGPSDPTGPVGPAPTRVRIAGSNWGGSMLKAGFIGRGMHMEFRHPEHNTVVTSRVREVREVSENQSPATGHQSPVFRNQQ